MAAEQKNMNVNVTSTILIVDDQPHLRELIGESLQEQGYRVVGAGNATKAREVFKQSNPDLVLLDLYLKGFQGWDLLRQFKKQDPHLPVLIVTAYDNYRDDPRLAEADGYIVKNFAALETLNGVVASLLSQESPGITS
ncbi:response regulator receiver domain protein [delta proteobacterium NaphS2]|nr:response regulator receiver domain protein [delta proteobacterium NaphS2]